MKGAYSQKYALLDLFAGCGGLSQGFRDAGFRITTAVEWWAPAAETYRRNHPDTKLFEGDIARVREQLFTRYNPEDFTGIIGGPPCQGYSVAGNRNVDDPRGALYSHFFDLVAYFRPKFFVMENVKGLLSMRHLDPGLPAREKSEVAKLCQDIARFKDLKRYRAQRKLEWEEESEFCRLSENQRSFPKRLAHFLVPLAEIIVARIQQIGYQVKYQVLNAADYGVPQRRERVFFIGSEDPSFLGNIFPQPTHRDPTYTPMEKLPQWLTVEGAIKDLEGAPANKELSHIFMKHKPEFVRRLERVAPGSTVFENYKDAWYRLRPDEPARTVKENHGGVFVHYNQPRCLTPRELARLQSFGDEFRFVGSKSNVLKQIGNAVPPRLACAVANQILEILEKQYLVKGTQASGNCMTPS